LNPKKRGAGATPSSPPAFAQSNKVCHAYSSGLGPNPWALATRMEASGTIRTFKSAILILRVR